MSSGNGSIDPRDRLKRNDGRILDGLAGILREIKGCRRIAADATSRRRLGLDVLPCRALRLVELPWKDAEREIRLGGGTTLPRS